MKFHFEKNKIKNCLRVKETLVLSTSYAHQCLFFINSLAPGNFEWNLRHVIFKKILMIDGWGISCEIALIWMSLDFTDEQSTLVQVMAWCRQATNHYLSQCWPRSLSPYGITRPQWGKGVLLQLIKHPLKTNECLGNKVWWLCLVPNSTTRFTSDVGYKIAKI